ncbi:Ig-like domain-containing protein [Hymenobacter sp. BT635]|uniref:glucan endo-1,3-beta-D-glucosidase n=1 Tax=Hymenobacter nitidus TaxID=2880929 RepID=A0ABS8ADJ3_9BACT|nr:glycosyl hydrolase [Hymenobacter nitidus]MCB2377285.1 Ig-like domain-containing protein [Hymenobacter nitidus]
MGISLPNRRPGSGPAQPRKSRLHALKSLTISLLALGLSAAPARSQIVPVGSGSYTTQFPGTDAAGRNAVPPGSPLVSGVAATKPVPTNEFWSAKLQRDHVNNIFNYPLTLRTHETGLVVNYIIPPSGPKEYRQPNSDVMAVTVGVQSLNAVRATVSDYSDWTVTMNWRSNSNDFSATVGMGMPFVYFTKAAADVAQVKVMVGTVTINGEMLLIRDSYNGADYAVYAPVGSTWTNNAGTYTSTLGGKTYWSMALLNPTAADALAAANDYKKYAYVFPAGTRVDWQYTDATAVLKTTFTVTPAVKEGTNNVVLQGLLPHQWGHLASGSAQPAGQVYPSVRGQLKMLAGNTFATAYTFRGVLPTLPYLANYSAGFSPVKLNDKVQALQNNGLAEWTDSYNEGQEMNKLIQTARIADEAGNTEARDKILATIKTRLEDWLSVEGGEKAFLFYYDTKWSTLLGYPAGHHQDDNLNDHHFHWGYFIHAAAFVEQYQPGWASQWSEMVNMLIRDAANPSRTDTKFPFLRNFDPYAGHAWADGFASSPMGNNQESTSESMQFNSALIHWGAITGNKATRDLGIYLYATEQTAIEEYWFDVRDRTFQPDYAYSATGRVWGAGYDAGTFWTPDIRAVYGIQLYPMHGGSLYLGQNKAYVQKLWTEITQNTGILQNEANPNTWHDLLWEYLAFIDPVKAIQLYDSYPNRAIKFGVSDAQTYYWLHAMNALGQVDATVTANNPEAAVFNKNGQKTYVAHNYSSAPITVTFSDGYSLPVPARKLATSRDVAVAGTIRASAAEVAANGSVTLTVSTTGSGITGVEFFDGATSLGTVTAAPYTRTAANLPVAIHNFYAKVYAGSLFKVTNIAAVQVGKQVSFTGSPQPIPGTIEAGRYDTYPGGKGQGISYNDASDGNQATYEPAPTVAFRTSENVDAVSDAAEGATVGWVDAGEWLEYTVNVATAGSHTLALRYAAGNAEGGGPFTLSVDGNAVGGNQTVTTTSNWGTWATKTITGLNLPAGEHVLRLSFTQGGLNVGRLTFTYTGTSTNTPPTVSLTSPTNGASFTAPATINITANAADANGTVSKVEFFQGATKLGEDLTAPYSFSWNGVATGTYSLTVKATDNAGATTTSGAVSVSVTSGTTNPGGTCTGGPTSGDYTYSVSGASPNPTLTFVPGRSGVGSTTLLLYYGTNAAGPYPGYVVTANAPFTLNASAGQTVYFYYTYSVPEGGERNTSSTPHSVVVGSCGTGTTNTPPTVSLTSPANNASFTAPATLNITANAADVNGTVSKVEFYRGTTLLGTDTSAPYSFSWTNVAAGSYSLTAKATDNAGATTTSGAVNVTVNGPATPTGYCATTTDFSYGAVTSNGNVTFTFHPNGATAGGNLAILYLREGSAGGYPGYSMTKNTAGDFTFTKAIASGTVTSLYFTYQVGAGGPERNSAATPFSYTVGATCSGQARTALPTASPSLAGALPELQLAPNPSAGLVHVFFTLPQSGAYSVALYDLQGRLVQHVATGTATGSKQLRLLAGSYPAGVYMLRLVAGGHTRTQRLVLTR